MRAEKSALWMAVESARPEPRAVTSCDDDQGYRREPDDEKEKMDEKRGTGPGTVALKQTDLLSWAIAGSIQNDSAIAAASFLAIAQHPHESILATFPEVRNDVMRKD